MSFEPPYLELSYKYQNSLQSTIQQRAMRPDRSTSNNIRRMASKIAPRLYLTCLSTASDVTQLANLGITHVVSVIENAPRLPSTLPLHKLHLSLSDYDDEDILSHLSTTTSFIRGALAENPSNRVLVRKTPVLTPYIHIQEKQPNRSTASWALAEARPW
ncbi:hypothetical protein B0F90DRAFT_1695919 [Multifurca ochricompacta]|uniref:Uncharacterized protein n=1 Tax=Multifurca ochricompacta TaxID=376703 RepID=A0AAD4M9S0_9AGAM|nr:hypothetical protein B0F90DRAFT_1695919 [Multifurca ochricompacta]